jgi:hypothetical protein
VLVLAAGSVRAGAVAEFDLAPVEVLLEFPPFAAGDLLVFFGRALRAPPVQECLIVADYLVIENGYVSAGGFEAEVAEQGSADVNRQAAVDQLGGEKPASFRTHRVQMIRVAILPGRSECGRFSLRVTRRVAISSLSCDARHIVTGSQASRQARSPSAPSAWAKPAVTSSRSSTFHGGR